MRCKNHPSDLSSTVGVCSTCLRERLFALIAAQAQSHHLPPPQPLPFPRSVSPYVSRRKSNHLPLDYRFYSTPQVGPTSATATATLASLSCKKKSRRFFSKIFSSRSAKHNPDLIPSDDPSVPSRNPSPSWFSSIFSTRHKKHSRFHHDDANKKPCRIIDQGISPARMAGMDDDCDRSPSGSGYLSESSQEWKKTPASGAAGSTARRSRASAGKIVSGLAFRLSPLVRASPDGHWNHKADLPSGMTFSGENKSPIKPRLSTAASYCANRSRKLADFGRPNNR